MLNSGGPCNDHRIGCAAEMGSVHLSPLERRAESPGPGRRKVVHVELAAVVSHPCQPLPNCQWFALIVAGVVSFWATFRTGPVVAEDFDHQRIVAFARIVNIL